MSFLGLSFSHIKRYPLALLSTLLAIACMVKLGMWQIDRGQEKQAIIDQHAQAMSHQPQLLSAAQLSSDELETDDRIQVQGRFQSDEYFLIDNQTFNGRVGYHVVALLDSESLSEMRLPVNLGWIPLPGSRDIWPDVRLPDGEVTVQGRIHYPAERPFLLREQQFSTTLPQRIQYLELESIREQTGWPLAAVSVLLDENIEWGFARDWPVVVMEPHRHYAYAAQWFGLAVAAAVIFYIATRRAFSHSNQRQSNKKKGNTP